MQRSEALWAARTYLLLSSSLCGLVLHLLKSTAIYTKYLMTLVYVWTIATGGAQHYPSSALTTVDGFLPLTAITYADYFGHFALEILLVRQWQIKPPLADGLQIGLPQREFHNHTKFQLVFFSSLFWLRIWISFIRKKYCQHIFLM